jgi:aminoglycoside phosphotransferase (APT) family kinase protein
VAGSGKLQPIDRPQEVDPQTPTGQLAAGLTKLMRAAIPSVTDIVLEDIRRSAGGLSRENWSVTATWRDSSGVHAERLMLMRDAAGTLLTTERAREYLVLKALEGSSVPAPVAHWVDSDGRFLAAPSLVMAHMPGQCDYLVLNGDRPERERLDLASAFLRLLVEIHRLDWRARGLGEALGVPDERPSRTELRHWESEFRQASLEPQPELEYVLAWLYRTAPEAQAIVLVHGDFKPGNALLDGDRITAKLDWETAHLGDPLEDLGWITNPVRRREHQIAGHWERAQIVEAYTHLSGFSVDEAHLRWWNVFACWKLAVIQLTAVHQFVAGRYDRVFQTPTWLFRPMFELMQART